MTPLPQCYAERMRKPWLAILVCLLPLSIANGQEKGLHEAPKPISSWRFEPDSFTGGRIPDLHGNLDIQLTKGGLDFAGDPPHQALQQGPDARPLFPRRDVDPQTLLPPTTFSVSAWVRSDKIQDWAGILTAIQDNGAYERGWGVGINGDRFFFGLASQGGTSITYLLSRQPVELGRWHHLVATYDGRRMRLYVDGRLESESLEQSGPVNWPPTTTISLASYHDDDEHHPLIGGLHSVQLYGEAIDETDVSNLFEEHAGTFPEPSSPDDEIAARPADPIQGWPMYRRDPRRSGATDEQLATELNEAWRHAVAPPKPSWPEPAQRSFWQNIDEAIPRVVFDLAHHPVSDGRFVVFASSQDDHVRCLDLKTGQLRWRVATDGPIRFAPVLHDGAVFVASDDGHLHRFDLDTGAFEWKVRLAPDDRRIPGNGRLISAWPIRTGPVIDRGVLHATCGLFPRFGTYAFAIDPASGEILWSRPLPGTSPQGYLLASSSRLFIPTGRTAPTTLGRGDGRNLGTFDLPGGTFALLVEDQLISGPGSEGTLGSADSQTRETAASFQADRGVVIPELVVLQRGDTLLAVDRPRLLALEAHRATLRQRIAELEGIQKNGQRDVSDLLNAARRELASLGTQITECELWRINQPASSLIMSGDSVIAAGDGRVSMINARTGDTTWDAPIKGRGHGLAIAGGHLLVSTDEGVLHAFRSAPPSTLPDKPTTEMNASAEVWRPELLNTIREQGMDQGIAVVVDLIDGTDALMLAESTDLHVIVLDDDPSTIEAVRTDALEQGMYGDRLVAHAVNIDESGIVDGIANVLMSERGLQGQSSEIMPGMLKLVRPNGGLLITGMPMDEADAGLLEDQFIPVDSSKPGTWRRVALPGAGEWTHPYADAGNSTASNDSRIGEDNALQWFGGPGPARMVDRHLRTTASLAQGGRLFIPGNDKVIAVDAYNGTELWELELPGFTRTGAPYDGGWWAISETGIHAAVGHDVVRIDPRNGTIIQRSSIPTSACVSNEDEWGWLALDSDLLLGSAMPATAARREQNRDAVVEQYMERRPLVTSHALFAMDPIKGDVRWTYCGGRIPNSSIASDGQHLYFVEGMITSEDDPASNGIRGRYTLASIGQHGLELVALKIDTGEEAWRTPLPVESLEHSLFVVTRDDAIAVVGCNNDDAQNQYHVSVHESATGEIRWSADHPNNRPGTGGDHGEQVHHPLIVGNTLIAEPLAYDLESGEVIDPTNQSGFSIRSRSGCGTMSASASCLFFRDGNPTMIDFNSDHGRWTKLTHVSRPGCWVNVIPAEGLILIPESSAGCVCGFSLQTSMALVPITQDN